MAMDKAKLADLLQNAGLGGNVEAILTYARPSIRLHAHPIENADSLPIGASHIGGLPDLPHGVAWPSRQGRPMEFIAQFNLRDVSRYDETGLLPEDGLLLFFFDGLSYEDVPYQQFQTGAETIIYHTGDLDLLERVAEFPALLEVWQRYRTCSITLEADWMLPNWPAAASFALEQDVLRAVGFEQRSSESPMVKAYRQVTTKLEPNKERDKHHLLGHPEPVIQDDPLFDVPGVWDCKDHKPFDKRALQDWMLLLQISSDSGPGMIWGDTSSVYYCIRNDDLLEKRFERALCTSQSC